MLLALEQARTANASVLSGWFEQWEGKLDKLREQLGSYTLFRLSDGIQMDEANWAVNVLGATGFDTTYISLNYDNIAESLLSSRLGTTHCSGGNCPHCRMRSLLQYACSCGITNEDVGDRWFGSLIKLHGSIAWRRCVAQDCCASECIDANCRCKPFEDERCPHCGKMFAPAMVYPTMSKNLGEIPQIGIMWQAARAAIEAAESILLFGFSLPTSDELLAQLVRSSCEKTRRLKRVAAIDLNPERVLGRFREAVSPGDEVEYVPLNVEPGAVPRWYNPPERQLFKWQSPEAAA
ncbi:MAG TPA: hypothetical protein DDW52_11555 [Planctomycetaceae bacterium]|nr:hypothetical protein [Planctomycetaceae bacterium]